MSTQETMYRRMLADCPDILDVGAAEQGDIKGLKVGRAYKIPKVRPIEYLLQEPDNTA